MSRPRVLVLALLLAAVPSSRRTAADGESGTGPRAAAVIEAWRAKDLAAIAALAKGDDPDPLDVVDALADAGELDAAAAFAEARVAEVRASGAPGVAHGDARYSLARVLARRGDRLRAREEYAAAAEAYPPEAALAAAAARIHAAELDFVLGSLRRGLEALERARGLLASDQHAWLGRLHRVEGQIRLALGESARALRALETARAEHRTAGEASSATLALHLQGDVLVTLGDFAEAERAYEAARREYASRGELLGVAQTYGKLAVVREFRGDHDGALRMLEPLRGLLKARGLVEAREALLQLLAFIRLRRGEPGDLEAALSFAKDAVRVAEEAGRGNRLSTALLALVQGRLGRAGEARALLEEAVAGDPRFTYTFVAVVLHTTVAATRLVVGDLAAARDGARDVVARVPGMVRGLGEEDSALAHQIYFDLYAVGTWASARLGDVPAAHHFLEAGRAGGLLESFGGHGAFSAPPVPEALQTAEAEARERWRAAEAEHHRAASDGDLPAMRVRRTARDEAWRAWEAAIARIQGEAKLAAGFASPEPAPLAETRDALREGEALVLYGLGKQETRDLLGLRDAEAVALVVTRKGERLVSLGPAAAIEEACGACRPEERRPDVAEALDRLRALVVGPLGLGPETRRVLVSPDGALHGVPFSALLAGRDVAFTPSGTVHLRLLGDGAKRGEGILAVGNPGSDLPGGEREARTLGDVVLLGERATETAFRSALPGRARWHAVHLACHGYADSERPMRSRLVLARSDEDDGDLTAMEVLGLRIPADLVVLSACETGRGRIYLGEGLVGLMRAFLSAGSPRVLCSLWKVDDDATLALMTEFYALWSPRDGAKGMDAAAALRAAQERVRSHERWRHPFFWAAWALWGLPE